MALQRLDNVGVVADDPARRLLFRELCLELEGRARSRENGPGVSPDRAINASHCNNAQPDGHGRLAPSVSHAAPVADHPNARTADFSP
jgi:hypothetical protein